MINWNGCWVITLSICRDAMAHGAFAQAKTCPNQESDCRIKQHSTYIGLGTGTFSHKTSTSLHTTSAEKQYNTSEAHTVASGEPLSPAVGICIASSSPLDMTSNPTWTYSVYFSLTSLYITLPVPVHLRPSRSPVQPNRVRAHLHRPRALALRSGIFQLVEMRWTLTVGSIACSRGLYLGSHSSRSGSKHVSSFLRCSRSMLPLLSIITRRYQRGGT